jgi:hypothetical protein
VTDARGMSILRVATNGSAARRYRGPPLSCKAPILVQSGGLLAAVLRSDEVNTDRDCEPEDDPGERDRGDVLPKGQGDRD